MIDLEVLDGPDPELESGVIVADHEGVVVVLEGGHGPHVAHSLLYCLILQTNLIIISVLHVFEHQLAIGINSIFLDIYKEKFFTIIINLYKMLNSTRMEKVKAL